MTSVHPPAVAGPARATDAVTHALGGLGTPVDCAGLRSLPPGRPAGAVARRGGRAGPVRGRRRPAGPLALPRPPGAGHAAARPGRGPAAHPARPAPRRTACCAASRCASCTGPSTATQWDAGSYARSTAPRAATATTPRTAARATAPAALEHAFALGIGRSLRRALPGAARRPAAPTTAGGRRRHPVDAGAARQRAVRRRLQRGGGRRPAGRRRDCGSGWSTSSTGCCPPLDRWIEQPGARPRGPDGGRHQGGRGRPRAGRPGAARVHRPPGPGRSAAPRTDRPATTPRSRSAARSRRRPGSRSPSRRRAAPSDDRIDPVERIAVASRVRTRAVRLDGRWWRDEHRPAGGPPGQVRRPGRAAVAARPATRRSTRRPGCGSRIGKDNAEEFEPRAVMFYRPLPERPMTPLAAAALQPARHPAGPAQPAARRAGDGRPRRAGAHRDRQGARRVRPERRARA